MGFKGRKSGPEQTRILPGFTLIITYIYILLTTEIIGRVLMLLSIRVEAEFAEERTEYVTTTTSQLRRSDEVGFLTVYDDTFTINLCVRVRL